VLLSILNTPRCEVGKAYTLIIGRAKDTPKLEAVTVEDQLGGAR
jgi:hypothetical protein